MFRKILRQPRFTWAGRGQALRRKRKPWYYEHEPRPHMVVLGARLSELIGRYTRRPVGRTECGYMRIGVRS